MIRPDSTPHWAKSLRHQHNWVKGKHWPAWKVPGGWGGGCGLWPEPSQTPQAVKVSLQRKTGWGWGPHSTTPNWQLGGLVCLLFCSGAPSCSLLGREVTPGSAPEIMSGQGWDYFCLGVLGPHPVVAQSSALQCGCWGSTLSQSFAFLTQKTEFFLFLFVWGRCLGGGSFWLCTQEHS